MLGAVLSDVLTLAPLYGVVAIGFVIVYRFTGVLNFAHGGVVAIGAYLMYFVTERLGFPLGVSFAITLIGGAALGVIMYAVLFRPLSGRSLFAVVLVTIALGIVIEGAITLIFGGLPRTLTQVEFTRDLHRLGAGVDVNTGSLFMLGLYVAVLAMLGIGLRYSRVGVRGRAAGENAQLASFRGVNVHLIFAIAWAVAMASGVAAGGLHVTTHNVTPGVAGVAFKAFPAALVGGMDSTWGTVFGAVLVAVGESLAFQLGSPLLSDAMPYAIMLVVLFVRPWGLFGTRELIDRV